MSEMQLLEIGNRAGQTEMRQRILDFLANLVDLAAEQAETNILHDVLTVVSEEVEPVTPFASDRAEIQRVIAAAELDVAASKLFRS